MGKFIERLPLAKFSPAQIQLKAFVKSPIIPNCYFLLDRFDPTRQQEIYAYHELVLKTTFIKVQEIYDGDDEHIGMFITHRPMQRTQVNRFVISLGRAYERQNVKVSNWQGDYLSVLEGETGCVLFNSCQVDNAVTRRLELI